MPLASGRSRSAMSAEKRRAALEEIAYSPQATPEARMRALDALKEIEPQQEEPGFAPYLREIPDDELDAQLVHFLAPLQLELDERVAEHLRRRTQDLERDFSRRRMELERQFGMQAEEPRAP